MQTRSSDENSVCLSVRLSVGPSDAWIVTKRKKNQSRFLHRAKEHLAILLSIEWVRSFNNMLPYVKFAEDKVPVFVILRENAKILEL